MVRLDKVYCRDLVMDQLNDQNFMNAENKIQIKGLSREEAPMDL